MATASEVALLEDLEKYHRSAVKAARQVSEFRRLSYRALMERTMVTDIVEREIRQGMIKGASTTEMATIIVEKLKGHDG